MVWLMASTLRKTQRRNRILFLRRDNKSKIAQLLIFECERERNTGVTLLINPSENKNLSQKSLAFLVFGVLMHCSLQLRSSPLYNIISKINETSTSTKWC